MKKGIRRKKWIKISDELPEVEDDYIVWGKKVGMHAATYVKGKGFLEYSSRMEITEASHFHSWPSEPRNK